jgi:hypothetical protein
MWYDAPMTVINNSIFNYYLNNLGPGLLSQHIYGHVEIGRRTKKVYVVRAAHTRCGVS